MGMATLLGVSIDPGQKEGPEAHCLNLAPQAIWSPPQPYYVGSQ